MSHCLQLNHWFPQYTSKPSKTCRCFPPDPTQWVIHLWDI